VLVGQEHTRGALGRLRKSGVPHVFTWSRGRPGRPTVGFDNRHAGRLVAEHLIDLGHKRVGMIVGHLEGNDRASARLAGVRDALAAARIPMPDSAVVQRPYSLEAGGDGFAALMRAKRPPTAIVCGNDVLALGAICEARARGIAVPAEVSLTGFDDMPMARVATPQLTTVRFPMLEIGWNAGELLLGLLGEEVGAVERELPIELVVRGSTGSPRP